MSKLREELVELMIALLTAATLAAAAFTFALNWESILEALL